MSEPAPRVSVGELTLAVGKSANRVKTEPCPSPAACSILGELTLHIIWTSRADPDDGGAGEPAIRAGALESWSLPPLICYEVAWVLG